MSDCLSDCQEALSEAEVELEALREFYKSWCFLHAVKIDPTGSDTWDKTRQQMAAQKLVEAAHKVADCQALH